MLMNSLLLPGKRRLKVLALTAGLQPKFDTGLLVLGKSSFIYGSRGFSVMSSPKCGDIPDRS